MIIWSGFGFVVLIVVVVMMVLVQLALGDKWSTVSWGPSVALIISAILTFGIDKLVFEKMASKNYIDKDTGEEVVLRKNHALFFIPIRFWPWETIESDPNGTKLSGVSK